MNKILAILFSAAIAVSLFSCSDDAEYHYGDGGSSEQKVETKLGWHCSVDKVKKYFDQYTPTVEDTVFLKYEIDDIISSYQFKNNKLIATLQLIPVDKADEEYRKSIVSGYEYLGMQSDNSVYFKQSNNTLIVLCEKTLNGVTYLQIGKTPIESNQYKSLEDIVVTTGDVTTLSKTYATITAKVTGVDYDFEYFFCYVQYGTSPDLSNSSSVMADESDVVKIKITGLVSGKTYYYRNYITVDGSKYYGEIKSFTTK